MTSIKKPVIILSGATATGKTSTSLQLAKKINRIEIINFDSLLFFRELNIGTAKPTSQEMASAPHHMINIVDINQEMNASEFCKQAIPLIEDIHQRSMVPLLVGGSAFYIRALIKGMYDAPEVTAEAKITVANIKEANGLPGLRKELFKIDSTSFDNIHENDEYRTTRALEFFFSTHQKYSDQKSKFDSNNPYDFHKSIHSNWSLLHLYMKIEKGEHWDIILKRTKQIIEQGLIQEVEEILKKRVKELPKPLQSIGYKETIHYLDSLLTESPMNKDQLIERIYISTRKLAKSQKTFFNKITPKEAFHPLNDIDMIVERTTHFLSSFL